MRSFIHLRYIGETTSPWHIGDTSPHSIGYGREPRFRRTRKDLMWGRGIRGPVLRQLWRTYCPRSDIRDGVDFKPEKNCKWCKMANECPFNNLRGSNDEGEWKDRPRLILTNLKFELPDGLKPRRLYLLALSERNMAAARGGYVVECIPSGTRFSFEAILMAEGCRFERAFDQAVRVSLEFFGWGGRCNEGFGKGRILQVERSDFNGFWRRYINSYTRNILWKRELDLQIETLLILDRDSGGFYTNSSESGFMEKLCHCLNERFWQFTGRHVYLQEAVQAISGGRPAAIRGWSRKLSREMTFRGISGSIKLRLKRKLRPEEAQALALARYGVGRYKNQGFGAMILGG